MTNYAVYQYGYAIFGIGNSREEAIEDARQYAEDIPDSVEDYSGQNVDGELYIIEITDDLYTEIDLNGWGNVGIECGPYPHVWDIQEDE